MKMDDDEADMLPFTFLKKYGAFINLTQEQMKLMAMNESRDYEGRWDEVKNL